MPFRATAKLLSGVLSSLSRRHLGGSTALFNLGMSFPCQAPTIFLPQFVADPSPKPPSLTHFGVCVCVSVWVSAFMFVFRYGFWRGFQAGFRALFAFWVCVSGVGFGLSLWFELGFCWLFSICWFRFGLLIFQLFFFVFLIWVLLIFLLVFSGFFDNLFLFFFTGS